MSHARTSRYSVSPAPCLRRGRSMSRSTSRSKSRSCESDEDVENPGNNLYVTGLSNRITKGELEKHFSAEGTVLDVHLVVDPWTRESRGFGFVTMSTVKEANRCIKYLNRSTLEGRVITVEKARRKRGRTPTPGRYLGLQTIRVRHRSRSSPYNRRGHSPSYSRGRSRSRSPLYRRRRSYSPCHRRRERRSESSSASSRSRPRSYHHRLKSPSTSPDSHYYGRRYTSREGRHQRRRYRPIYNAYPSSRSMSYSSYSRSPVRILHERPRRGSTSRSRRYRSLSSSISPRRSPDRKVRGFSRESRSSQSYSRRRDRSASGTSSF